MQLAPLLFVVYPVFYGMSRKIQAADEPGSSLALSVSHTLDSSPKGRASGEIGNFAWTAKASHFEERLSPAGERCRVSDRVGNVAMRKH